MSGCARPTTSRTASASRRSATWWSSDRRQTGQGEQCRLGSGASDRPVTCAPRPDSHHRRPAALETGMPGQKHALALPEGHRSGRSRALCRRPKELRGGSCRAECPSAARSRHADRSQAGRRGPSEFSGSPSNDVSSPSIRSSTAGSSTKKPPLMRALSPGGFSVKVVTGVVGQFEGAVAAGRHDAGDGCETCRCACGSQVRRQGRYRRRRRRRS